MTLDQVPPGKRCRIDSVGGSPTLVQRLMEFGLIEGEAVQVIATAPLGDPIEIESDLSRLSLRRADACHVHVSPLD